jgi:hypothetical protein
MIAIAMLPADYWAGVADWMPAHSTATTPMREVLGQAYAQPTASCDAGGSKEKSASKTATIRSSWRHW